MIPREEVLEAERMSLLKEMGDLQKMSEPRDSRDYRMDLGLKGAMVMPFGSLIATAASHQVIRKRLGEIDIRLGQVHAELREIRAKFAIFQAMTLEQKVDAIAQKVLF